VHDKIYGNEKLRDNPNKRTSYKLRLFSVIVNEWIIENLSIFTIQRTSVSDSVVLSRVSDVYMCLNTMMERVS